VLIARLIADHSDLETRLDATADALARADMPLASAVMLDVGARVVEMRFPEAAPGAVLDAIDTHFAPCDALVSSREIEVPHLFVSDMDSTMIGQECIDELADYAGIKEQIAAITERAMQGELDFEAALRERVGLLAGLDESAVERCLKERIAPTPGAKVLVGTLAARGARTVLVTGGFHHFADAVAEWLGFDRVVGNRLGVADGKLTGSLDGPISDAGTKLAVLREEAEAMGANARILSSGDGANDIPIIEAADYGFAYRAKVKARAAANGRIDRGDLTAILSLLGIPHREWVEG
jgi:phosphoserine phosphatase